jgi:hypothetical protein
MSARLLRFVALLLTVAVGIASRRLPLGIGWWDKSLGDALYAGAVFLVLGLLAPSWKAVRCFAAALAICVAIELFQATGIPMRYAHVPVVRWVLGTRFALHDILCYAVGVVLFGGAQLLVERRRGATTVEPPGR